MRDTGKTGSGLLMLARRQFYASSFPVHVGQEGVHLL